MKLDSGFYLQKDVIKIAHDLIGKVVYTCFGNKITAGIITETEAYNGIVDKASHAYNGRRTLRNEMMYANGGTGYVYKCYGIHDLFNVVTNEKDIPHAVLIRAVYPLAGLKQILQRRKQTSFNKTTSGGPGTVSQALGILLKHNGTSLSGNTIWIEDNSIQFDLKKIKTSPRIGVESAGADAKLPYRFYIDFNDCNKFYSHLIK